MLSSELKEYFLKTAKGDTDAFTRIYSELKLPVYTVAFRIVQSKEAAEDITHDVFVKLFVSPPDSSVKNHRAWVFQTARNLAIDALRRKRLEDRETMTEDFCPEEDIDLRLDIENAIGKLSQTEREILTLHINCELRFAEISKITGLSLPAVYRRYRNALTVLRETLDGGTL